MRNPPRLTQNSLRTAVSETVRPLQADKTDHEFAEEWGTSAGTVANARNRNHTIGLEAYLRLGKEFGGEGLDTVLALVGRKSAPLNSVIVDTAKVPCEVAKCLPLLIERLSDGEWSDDDQRAFEEAGVVHTLLNLADKMREKRDERRLRSVTP